jgi:nitrate/nitrite-specific signal transduction histidine kinase
MGPSTLRPGWRPRRRVFLHRRFQARFALVLVAVQALVLLALQGLIHVRIESLRQTLPGSEADQALRALATQNLLGICFGLLCAVLLMVALVSWFSRRVVGPLPRLKEALARLAAGDYAARIHLRPEDYLGDLADEFNAAAMAIQRRHAEPEVGAGSGPVRPLGAQRPVGAESWVG